mmetsp:Transcript_24313/g.31579  ORF Transcript_24313/g.31579 Transcript_24313/m.31579 type:complete len:171 (+) Transcript_24313:65-577(+)
MARCSKSLHLYLLLLIGICTSQAFITPTEPRSCSSIFRMHSHGNNNLARTTEKVSYTLAAVGLSLFTLSQPVNAGVINAPQCVDGVGSSCEAMAEGNELIAKLQKRSAENRERYAQETLDRYNENNFVDYFKAIDKKLVKKPDGKYELLTFKEYATLEKSGKIKDGKFIE